MEGVHAAYQTTTMSDLAMTPPRNAPAAPGGAARKPTCLEEGGQMVHDGTARTHGGDSYASFGLALVS